MQTPKFNSQPNPSSATTPNFPTGHSKALLWSLAIIRVIGYSFLLFSFFDFLYFFIPPRLTNPEWEFQTAGMLVESAPVLLLAFALIYAGREIGRNPKERFILPLLPWLSLILGIFYLLTVPLGILNTNRLLKVNNRQMVQIEERQFQVNKIKDNLEKATTQEDMNKLLQDLGNENPLPQLTNDQLEEVKDDVANFVQEGENEINTQTERLKSVRLNLLLKSVKWNFGAFLSGVLFIYIWRIMRRH